MDIGMIRGIGTAMVFIAFIGVLLWAYSKKRKSSFDEAANLPFADDVPSTKRDEQASGSNKE